MVAAMPIRSWATLLIVTGFLHGAEQSPLPAPVEPVDPSSLTSLMATVGAYVEPSNGRIRRIENRFEFSPTSRAVLRVAYEEHPNLQMLVPTSMWEWYQGGAARLLSPLKPSGSRPGDPYIECFATYSNFRRFSVDTTERVKRPH
jgi:hypothetical protein